MASVLDVAIIGAGAAGLAALNELDQRGCDNVLCLEARDRIGGRIYSVRDPLCATAVELGAEFVHGRSREIWDVVEANQLSIYDCGDSAVRMSDGHAQTQDAWEKIGGVMQGMAEAAGQGSDRTFQQFLDTADYSAQTKLWATGYVEGFNAARAEEVSIQALAQETQAADEIDGDSAFRLIQGYDTVPLALLRGVRNGAAKLRLNSIVESVAWQAGSVSVRFRHGVTGHLSTAYAKKLVVTVPLGVLQAQAGDEGAIQFQPELKEVTAAARALRVGQAVRVVLRFRQAFWEKNEDVSLAGFLLSDERVFPTWWTPLAVRAPIITGWCAGPKADALLGLPKADLVSQALNSLSRIIGPDAAQAGSLLEAAYFHDWHADSFARGAYSYVPAGALALREKLAQPLADTLFFAGEATETEGYCATVHGAIASGRRAARQVTG